MTTPTIRRLLTAVVSATLVAACGGGDGDSAGDAGTAAPATDAAPADADTADIDTTTGADDESDPGADISLDDAAGATESAGAAGAGGAGGPSGLASLCDAVPVATMSALTGRTATVEGPGMPIMCTYDLDDSGDFIMLEVFEGDRLANARDGVTLGRQADSDVPDQYPGDYTVAGLPAYGGDWVLLVDAGDWGLHVSGMYGLVVDYDGQVTPQLLVSIAKAALAGIAAGGGPAAPVSAGSAGAAPPIPTEPCSLVDDAVVVELTGSPLAPWMDPNPMATPESCAWWLELGGATTVVVIDADFDPGVTASMRAMASDPRVETSTIAGWPAFGFAGADEEFGNLSAGLYVDLGEWLLAVDINEDNVGSGINVTLQAARGIAEAALG